MLLIHLIFYVSLVCPKYSVLRNAIGSTLTYLGNTNTIPTGLLPKVVVHDDE